MKRNKIKQISKKIVSALKEASRDIEFKMGVDVELVPKPTVRFFAHIHKLRKMLDDKVKQNGNSKSDNQSLQDNDESIIKREST